MRLIDVLWLDRNGQRVRAAFEVEHTTSIYSGIVRPLAYGELARNRDVMPRFGEGLKAVDAVARRLV